MLDALHESTLQILLRMGNSDDAGLGGVTELWCEPFTRSRNQPSAITAAITSLELIGTVYKL